MFRKPYILLGFIGAAVACEPAGQVANPIDPIASAFQATVSADGAMRVPENFATEFVYLGGWSVAHTDESARGAGEIHGVYAPTGAVEAFKTSGQFPDRTVLVKALYATQSDTMTTGFASRAANPAGWFVMVKDAQGRFADNPLWGDGWGWAFFGPDDPNTTTSTNYVTDCRGCHLPAESTDWVYTEGYPVLGLEQ